MPALAREHDFYPRVGSAFPLACRKSDQKAVVVKHGSGRRRRGPPGYTALWQMQFQPFAR